MEILLTIQFTVLVISHLVQLYIMSKSEVQE